MNIGIDITSNKRFDKFIDNERFLKRVLSQKEFIKYSNIQNKNSKKEFLAGRFSAKEAIIKSSSQPKLLSKISIENDSFGAPLVIYDGIEQKNIKISISHEKEYSTAVAIFL